MTRPSKPPWIKRIDALNRKLATLTERGSRLRFLPPLTEHELATLEARLEVTFSDEHRAFLTRVTRGEEPTGTAPLLSPEAGRSALLPDSRPSADFPIGDSSQAADLIERLSRAHGKTSIPGLDGPADGVLPIMDHGCGTYDCLVLTGPQRGRIWQWTESGWFPCFQEKKGLVEPLGLLSWLEAFFREAVADAPKPITPDSREVELFGLGLTVVPPGVFQTTQLERLALSCNAILELSPDLGRLTSLRELVVAGNALRAFPPSLGELRSLRRLLANANQLEALPDTLGDLAALERLDVGQNRLTALPERIGDLQRLVTLEVAGNRLEGLPESVGRLKALTRLRIEGNPLRTLPEGLANTALEELDLQELPALDMEQALRVAAQIPTLKTVWLYEAPPEALPALAGLRQVRTLRLIRCGLETVPPEVLGLKQLEALSLDQNRLTTLPDVLGTMPRLKRVILFSNPLEWAEVHRLRARWPHLALEYL